MELKLRPDDWERVWPLAFGQDDYVWRFTDEELSLFENLVSEADPENAKIFVTQLEETCSAYKVFYDNDQKTGDRDILRVTNDLRKAKEALDVNGQDAWMMLKMIFATYPFPGLESKGKDLNKFYKLFETAFHSLNEILISVETHHILSGALKGTRRKGRPSTTDDGFVSSIASSYILLIGDITTYKEGSFAQILSNAYKAMGQYNYEKADMLPHLKRIASEEKERKDIVDSIPEGAGLTSKSSLKIPHSDYQQKKRIKKSR